MNADLLFDPTFSLRLCLTLLHSLWQMLLIAIVVWGAGRLIRHRSVERRYLLHVSGLVTGLALLPLTFLLVDVPSVDSPVETSQRGATAEFKTVDADVPVVMPRPDDAIPIESSLPPAPLVSVAVEAAAPPTVTDAAEPTADTPHPIAGWIVAAYAAGVLVMLVRLAIGLWSAHRLAAKAALIAEGPTLDLLRSLARHWSMRITPALAIAEHVIVPKVVGLLRPTILLPASAVTGLSTDELRMILAHELAHIRRHDLWINLLQRLAETVLFFNPALWYLSRRISTLREYCCDELTCRGVLAARGSAGALPSHQSDARASYAAALVRVAELSQSNTPESPARHRPRPSELATLAASGRSPSDLRRRIAHLFGEPIREPVRLSRGRLTLLITVAALLAFGLPLIPTRAQTTDAAADQNDDETVDRNDVEIADRLPKKFSFGGKVEVVAIGTHNEVPQQWWDAAGQPVESVPFTWFQEGSVGAEGDPRRIVLRLDELPEDAEVKWDIVGSTGWTGGNVKFEGEQPSGRYFTRFFIANKGRETIDLRVGVASGVWKTVSEMQVDGSQALGLADKKSLVYSGSFDTPRGVVAIVSHNFFDTNFRVVAVDKHGAIHDSTSRGGVSAGGIYQTKSTFPNLMSNEIDHFEFQTRDYEWVEIDELPLNPVEKQVQPAPPAEGAGRNTGQKTTPPVGGDRVSTVLISGTCITDEGHPIGDAEVWLYRYEMPAFEVSLLQIVRTNEYGHYEFQPVPAPSLEQRQSSPQPYAVGAKAEGYGSVIRSIPIGFGDSARIDLAFKKAATLKGRVTGPGSLPIAGADVWTQRIGNAPLEGILSDKTDADGRFEIPDIEAWKSDEKDDVDPNGRSDIRGRIRYVFIHHPEYGEQIGEISMAATTADLKLEPAAIVEGRVVFDGSGQPAAGVVVRACNQSGHPTGSAFVKTDERGEYRFVLPASHYNFWTHHDELAIRAIQGFVARSGQTLEAPDLVLIKGGIVKGRLINAATGEPVHLRDGDVAQWLIKGPARPNSSGASQVEPIRADGTFEFRLPAGRTRLSLPHTSFGTFQLLQGGRPTHGNGLELNVTDGRTHNLELNVVRVTNDGGD